MTMLQIFVAGTVLVGLSFVGCLVWLWWELRDADRRWEADREARITAYETDLVEAWEAHVQEALAAATDVPDYVPTEWSER